MRSKKPGTGLLITVLLMLAVLQLAVGLFAIFMVREYRDQVEPEIKAEEHVTQEDQDAIESDDAADQTDKLDEEEQDDSDLEEEDEEEAEDEEDEEDEEEDKDYVMMTVQAPDNYAAVRAGRGTSYKEVGRIVNGNKVALTDLKNGWYKIAKGKYKGYYTHQSSFVAG